MFKYGKIGSFGITSTLHEGLMLISFSHGMDCFFETC